MKDFPLNELLSATDLDKVQVRLYFLLVLNPTPARNPSFSSLATSTENSNYPLILFEEPFR